MKAMVVIPTAVLAFQMPINRINAVMQRLIARDATEEESRVLVAGLERTRTQFSQDSEQAVQLISMGESIRDESLDPVEHAAWTSLGLAVLNLDETLTRE